MGVELQACVGLLVCSHLETFVECQYVKASPLWTCGGGTLVGALLGYNSEKSEVLWSRRADGGNCGTVCGCVEHFVRGRPLRILCSGKFLAIKGGIADSVLKRVACGPSNPIHCAWGAPFCVLGTLTA